MFTSWEQFAQYGWSEIRKKLRQMKDAGMTLQEIADVLGFKSRSHVKGLIDGDRASLNAPLTQFFSYLERLGIDYLDYLPVRQTRAPEDQKPIPVFGIAGAGPAVDESTPLCTIYVPETYIASCDYAVEVSGNSMSPTIPDKGVCGIKKDTEFIPGRIYLAYVPDEGHVIKRVRLDLKTGAFVFHSDNPDQKTYPEFNIPLASAEKIILGSVEWILRRDL